VPKLYLGGCFTSTGQVVQGVQARARRRCQGGTGGDSTRGFRRRSRCVLIRNRIFGVAETTRDPFSALIGRLRGGICFGCSISIRSP
jgi:hypothetical protein